MAKIKTSNRVKIQNGSLHVVKLKFVSLLCHVSMATPVLTVQLISQSTQLENIRQTLN